MEQNKTGRYFKYAIGEIILVMIGILLALGINNWNEDRISDKRQLVYLKNLQDDLISNIKNLIRMDSVYSAKEKATIEGIERLNNYPSIYDFKLIDSLVGTHWTTFSVNRSTYNEMLNNGSFYSLNNKNLKDKIDNHYLLARSYESAFAEINSKGQAIRYNRDIYSLEILRDRLNQSDVNLTDIDTTWIHNPNSPIYAGFYTVASFYERTNSVRLSEIRNFSQSCEELIEAINNELTQRE